MRVTRVSKRVRLTRHQSLKYQLLTELVFLREQPLISYDLDILAFLALHAQVELRHFCTLAARELHPDTTPEKFSLRQQHIRNRVGVLARRQLILKHKPATGKTTLQLSPDLGIVLPDENPVLLDFQFLTQ